MPVAVEWRIRCERSGTDSAKRFADRGFGVAKGGIPGITGRKNLTARFSISDNGFGSRCFAVKSHGRNLRCKAFRRKPEMLEPAYGKATKKKNHLMLVEGRQERRLFPVLGNGGSFCLLTSAFNG